MNKAFKLKKTNEFGFSMLSKTGKLAFIKYMIAKLKKPRGRVNDYYICNVFKRWYNEHVEKASKKPIGCYRYQVISTFPELINLINKRLKRHGQNTINNGSIMLSGFNTGHQSNLVYRVLFLNHLKKTL